MLSDPIADMLTRIRNAVMAGHATVAIPHSKMKMAIAQILKDEGFIEDVTLEEGKPAPVMVIKLKYWGQRRERRPVITNLKRVSKPGRRIYVGKDEIPWGAQWHGHRHSHHAQRNYDRPAGASPGRWWRGALLRLVKTPERRRHAWRARGGQ
jgi:SSU ribosomal protein S8P